MVQINLLPGAAKKRPKRKIALAENIKVEALLFILIAAILAVAVVWATLGFRLNSEKKKLARQGAQLQSLQSTLKKLDKLNQEKERLTSRLEFVDSQLNRKIFWSENLNRLSKLLPSGIWLKTVILHTKNENGLKKYSNLNISGSAVSLQTEEMIDLIGAFMSSLKKDNLFAEQFSEIELISSNRNRSNKIEIMDFELLCRFR